MNQVTTEQLLINLQKVTVGNNKDINSNKKVRHRLTISYKTINEGRRPKPHLNHRYSIAGTLKDKKGSNQGYPDLAQKLQTLWQTYL